jgi:hypothetical protein
MVGLGGTIPKPFNESFDPGFDLRLRIVAEELAGSRDIGKRLRYVTRLQWLPVNPGGKIELLFQQRYQFSELDGP